MEKKNGEDGKEDDGPKLSGAELIAMGSKAVRVPQAPVPEVCEWWDSVICDGKGDLLRT